MLAKLSKKFISHLVNLSGGDWQWARTWGCEKGGSHHAHPFCPQTTALPQFVVSRMWPFTPNQSFQRPQISAAGFDRDPTLTTSPLCLKWPPITLNPPTARLRARTPPQIKREGTTCFRALRLCDITGLVRARGGKWHGNRAQDRASLGLQFEAAEFAMMDIPSMSREPV